MVGWSRVQQERLTVEKGILEKFFLNNIIWIDQMDSTRTRVEVEMKSNSNKVYKLRLYLPEDFPNSCPPMAIVYPPNLRTRDRNPIPLLSQPFHTLGRTVDGFTKLCHYSPDLWTVDLTLYHVLMKGRLWIEAYEGHLETGNSLDFYLGEQEETAEGQNEEQNPVIDESVVEPEPTVEQTPKSSCCIS